MVNDVDGVFVKVKRSELDALLTKIRGLKAYNERELKKLAKWKSERGVPEEVGYQ